MDVDHFSRFLRSQLDDLHERALLQYSRTVCNGAVVPKMADACAFGATGTTIGEPTPNFGEVSSVDSAARRGGQLPTAHRAPLIQLGGLKLGEGMAEVMTSPPGGADLRERESTQLDQQDLCICGSTKLAERSLCQHCSSDACLRSSSELGDFVDQTNDKFGPCPAVVQDKLQMEQNANENKFAVQDQVQMDDMSGQIHNVGERHTNRTQSGQDAGFTNAVRPDWVADDSLLARMANTVHKSRKRGRVSQEREHKIRYRSAVRAAAALGRRMYSASHSMSDIVVLPRLVMHPHSQVAFAWDITSLLFILYDIVVTPLRVFVLPKDYITAWADASVTMFFTCDCIMTFNRGVYIEGEIDFSRRTIARKYLTSWFIVDLLVLIPDWVTIIVGSTFLSSVSLVRMLRLTRMLRLLQIDKVVSLFQEQFNSNFVVQFIDLAKLVACILVMIHICACAWCMLRRENGWEEGALEASSLGYLYIASFHWSLTQFHGGTDVVARNMSERVFNVIVLFLALLAYGSYLSRLTDMVLQMEKLHHGKRKAQQVLRKYLDAHNISTQLAVRVKRYVEYHIASLSKEHQLEYLNVLPRNLLLDLLSEGRSPVLRGHSMFQYLLESYPRAMRIACHDALNEVVFSPDDVVFASGDACSHMQFVVSGTMNYTIDLQGVLHRAAPGQRLRVTQILQSKLTWKLRKGFWMCEPALWTPWTNVGAMETVSTCVCLVVNAVKFAVVLKQHEEAYVDAVFYAADYVQTVNAGVFTTDLDIYLDNDAVELEQAFRWNDQAFHRSDSHYKIFARNISEPQEANTESEYTRKMHGPH